MVSHQFLIVLRLHTVEDIKSGKRESSALPLLGKKFPLFIMEWKRLFAKIGNNAPTFRDALSLISTLVTTFENVFIGPLYLILDIPSYIPLHLTLEDENSLQSFLSLCAKREVEIHWSIDSTRRHYGKFHSKISRVLCLTCMHISGIVLPSLFAFQDIQQGKLLPSKSTLVLPEKEMQSTIYPLNIYSGRYRCNPDTIAFTDSWEKISNSNVFNNQIWILHLWNSEFATRGPKNVFYRPNLVPVCFFHSSDLKLTAQGILVQYSPTTAILYSIPPQLSEILQRFSHNPGSMDTCDDLLSYSIQKPKDFILPRRTKIKEIHNRLKSRFHMQNDLIGTRFIGTESSDNNLDVDNLEEFVSVWSKLLSDTKSCFSILAFNFRKSVNQSVFEEREHLFERIMDFIASTRKKGTGNHQSSCLRLELLVRIERANLRSLEPDSITSEEYKEIKAIVQKLIVHHGGLFVLENIFDPMFDVYGFKFEECFQSLFSQFEFHDVADSTDECEGETDLRFLLQQNSLAMKDIDTQSSQSFGERRENQPKKQKRGALGDGRTCWRIKRSK